MFFKSYTHHRANFKVDRAPVAYKLWECCAIPAALYCAEASVISQACVQKIDSIQIRSRGLFFSFQDLLPGCVAGYVDARLKPIQDRLDTRTMMFAWKVLNGKRSQRFKQIMNMVIMDAQDRWTTRLLNLCGASGLGLLNNRSTLIRRSLHEAAVTNILLVLREHSSLVHAPTSLNCKNM